ncbi:MAG: hypothetical protein ACR2PI_16300 [Hyphomicrobiaceae bacterium]
MSPNHSDSGSSLFLEVAFDTLDQVRELADLANEQGKKDLSIALLQIMKEIARSIDNAEQSERPERDAVHTLHFQA